MRTIALIPAYEPGDELLKLLEELAATDSAVVIVDDGSGADYERIFEAAKKYAQVISYGVNRGKGFALKTGFEYIAGHFSDEDIIVTLDSDGQHTVGDMLRVAEKASSNPASLTLGVRAFDEGTPARSRFGNSITRAVFSLSTGVKVSDTQTGLRAFGVGLLPALQKIKGDRYEYEMNVLLECPELDIRIEEVPIRTIYRDGNKGSHFHTFRDSFLVYRRFLKFAASSLTGFITDYAMYSLFVWLFGGLGTAVAVPVSNVCARVISAGVNFTINKYLVFKSKDSVLKTGTQYFLLAVCILAGNTLLLSAMVNLLHINKYIAKLVTEVTFFTLSFIGQRFWIFRKKS